MQFAPSSVLVVKTLSFAADCEAFVAVDKRVWHSISEHNVTFMSETLSIQQMCRNKSVVWAGFWEFDA